MFLKAFKDKNERAYFLNTTYSVGDSKLGYGISFGYGAYLDLRTFNDIVCEIEHFESLIDKGVITWKNGELCIPYISLGFLDICLNFNLISKIKCSHCKPKGVGV